eukprot:g6528.t1
MTLFVTHRFNQKQIQKPIHTVNNLAELLEKQNKLKEAEELYQRALNGFKEIHGPNHQYTLNTKGNLGHCLMLQNNPLGREMVVDAFNKLKEGPNGIKASHPWYKKFNKILNGNRRTLLVLLIFLLIF